MREQTIYTVPGTNLVVPMIVIDPPNPFFDSPTIPTSPSINYNEIQPCSLSSEAIIERTRSSVISCDPSIDRNAPQLWLYFITYLNEKPHLQLEIRGSHTELETGFTPQQYFNGHWTNSPVAKSSEVNDFRFTIDLSPYLIAEWERFYLKSNHLSFRNLLEEYTRSDRYMKEIICEKQIAGWNFDELKDKIKQLILSSGYRDTVSIKTTISRHHVIARSSSTINQMAHSKLIRCCCISSCLCLIGGPIYSYMRASTRRPRYRMFADYRMLRSIETFLQWNGALILHAIEERSNQIYSALILE